MFCTKCGKELRQDQKFCTQCGASVKGTDAGKLQEQVRLKQKSSAGVGIVLVVTLVFLILVASGVAFWTLGGKDVVVSLLPHRNDIIALETEEDETEITRGRLIDTEQMDDNITEETKKPIKTADTIESSISKDVENDETTTVIDEIGLEPDENDKISKITMSSINKITATSELSEYNMTHSAERICDGSLDTAWVEGALGQGVGESVMITFDNTYEVSGIRINAGYQKTAALYNSNSRPSQLLLTFSDDSSQLFSLEDICGMQSIQFQTPVQTDYIKITIEGVFAGSKYEDTVISEIELY